MVRGLVAAVGGAALLAGGLAAPATAAPPGPPGPPERTTSAGDPVDLGALFVGAHPDDEAGTLSTFGQWGQDHGLRTGVVTITRGEGGGNAVGPEEGPALGLLREAEERAAVGRAGITEVFNLDEVDFYYTVSAPLTQQVWGEDDTLAEVVRLVRQTRPEVLVTMDPAPSPGNHGNHQEAARLALEAFYAAADPLAFPEQLAREGLRPWAASRVLLNRSRGTGTPGPACATSFVPVDPSQTVYGVWSGRDAGGGRTWAQVERDAQRVYASQGWAVFPDVPTDPAQLGCDYLTQVDSRVPSARPGSAAAADPAAALYGATVRAPGGTPLGTGLAVRTSQFDVQPGERLAVTVTAQAPDRTGLGRAQVRLQVPAGWRVRGDGDLGALRPGRSATATFTVTAPADAAPGTRVRVGASLRTDRGTGWADRPVQVAAEVTAHQQPLPQVAEFEEAVTALGLPQLQGFVQPVLTLPSGGSREVRVDLRSASDEPEQGTVAMELPAGFAAEPVEQPYEVAAGGTASVTFTVTNTDASLPTSNQGGTAGDYLYALRTTTGDGSTSTTTPALELVPSTTVPAAATAPVVDGVASPGEYAGEELDLSRLWEGTACTSPADCSATGHVTHHDGDLYVHVDVTDDVAGTALAQADCKRHWRTDSVEVAVDPTGTSENTSTTFKAFVLPRTAQGGPCAGRDADNRQGPAAETAPGLGFASVERAGGWSVELKIDAADLPAAVDPQRMGFDAFVYDSDTQDRTGQTRIGWSTWQGVQGDPYRWGRAVLEGYEVPDDAPDAPVAPVVPSEALDSLDSPQSLEQAVRVDVPLAGGPQAPARRSGWVAAAEERGSAVAVRVRATGAGRMTLFVRDAGGTAGQRAVRVPGAGTLTVRVPLDRALDGPSAVVAGWRVPAGTLASRTPVR
nr:sugar-binding protein [Vallicoccus soli]